MQDIKEEREEINVAASGSKANLQEENAAPEFSFIYLKDNLDNVHLPCDEWCYVKVENEYVGFVKVESDTSLRRRVFILPDSSVKVFFNETIEPLSEYIKIMSIDELNSLLQTLDEMN